MTRCWFVDAHRLLGRPPVGPIRQRHPAAKDGTFVLDPRPTPQPSSGHHRWHWWPTRQAGFPKQARALHSEGCRNRQTRRLSCPLRDLHTTQIRTARFTRLGDTEFGAIVATFLAWSDEITAFPEPAASWISNDRLEGTNNSSRVPDAMGRRRVLQPSDLQSPWHPRLRPTRSSQPRPAALSRWMRAVSADWSTAQASSCPDDSRSGA